MIPFTEELRYAYPGLTAADVVIDAGCYEGKWTAVMNAQYGCRVIAFEPVPDFWHRCSVRFEGNPKIEVHRCALGNRMGATKVGIRGDSSGLHCAEAPRHVDTPLVTLGFILQNLSIPEVAVLKLNVEGSEFDILEHAIDNGYIVSFKHIQVQPHTIVPDAEARWFKIFDRLTTTHDCNWAAPWCWYGFTRK